MEVDGAGGELRGGVGEICRFLPSCFDERDEGVEASEERRDLFESESEKLKGRKKGAIERCGGKERGQITSAQLYSRQRMIFTW